jgi:hypothetical protein
VPRDAAASTVGVSSCAWSGRRGAGAASRRSARPASFYLLSPTLATNYSKI